MWDACGQLNPSDVAIHVSDPLAFFTPPDRFNGSVTRKLNNNPDWSFYGGDFPQQCKLLEARKNAS